MKNVRLRRWNRAAASAALLATGAMAQVSRAFDVPFPGTEPCSTLTSFEVSAAVGMPVEPRPILFGSGPTAGCSFARAGGERIALLILRVASAEWLAEQASRMHQGSIADSYLEVNTTGERAFLFGKQSARPVLCVFKNPYYLQISIPGVTNGKQHRAALETLARAALRRLTPSASFRADGGPALRAQR
jgi:hypothetical protein